MPKGVYKRTPETLEKIRKNVKKAQVSWKGKKHSKEAGEKIRQSKIGKKRVFTPEWIENLRKASIKAGCRPPSPIGRKWTKEQRENYSRARKGKGGMKGEKNPRWMGNNVGYSALHAWLRETYGNANHCDNPDCERKSNKFEWALKAGKRYERKRKNFWQLCRVCHHIHDVENGMWGKRSSFMEQKD